MRSVSVFCQVEQACQPLPGKKPTLSSSRVEERPKENVRVPFWPSCGMIPVNLLSSHSHVANLKFSLKLRGSYPQA